MIVKKCSPSTNLNYMDGREGSRAREAMGLLKVMRGTAKRLSRLPNAIAAENPRWQWRSFSGAAAEELSIS